MNSSILYLKMSLSSTYVSLFILITVYFATGLGQSSHSVQQLMSEIENKNGTNDIFFEGKLEKSFDEYLKSTLIEIVVEEFSNCFVTIVYEELYEQTQTIAALSTFSNFKQIYKVSSIRKLDKMIWKSSSCNSYVFLISNVTFFFTKESFKNWNMEGRYLIVTPRKSVMEETFKTEIAMKTEHFNVLCPSLSSYTWLLYTKNFFPVNQVSLVNKQNPVESGTRASRYPEKFRDYHGSTLRLMTFDFPPSVIYTKNNNDSFYPYGRDIEIVRLVSQGLNFKIDYVYNAEEDQRWGVLMSDGTYSGLLGAIRKNKTDIAIANCFLSYSREDIIDYPEPFDYVDTCFMDYSTDQLPQWQSLLRAFGWSVWMGLLGVLIASTVLLYTFAVILRRMGRESFPPDFQCFIIAFQPIVHEGTGLIVHSVSLKVFLAFLWTYALILTIAYPSNLTAHLTINKPAKSIESIQELYDSSKSITIIGEFFKNALLSSYDPTIKSLGDRTIYKDNVEMVLQEVREDNAVYLQNRPNIEYLMTLDSIKSNRISHYRIMKECFSTSPISMYIVNNSPMRKSFNRVIARIVEAGLSQKLKTNSLDLIRSMQTKGNDQNAFVETENLNRLKMDHVQGLFIVLIMGHILAILVFIIEMFFGIRKKIN